jgi:hypothetical protein
MTVGLPGTGIGGLFYLLLTLWMPVREIRSTLAGRGDARRWRFIAGKLAIVGMIVTALGAEAWAIGEAFGWLDRNLGTELLRDHMGALLPRTRALAIAAACATLASLGVVLAAMHVARVLVRRSVRPATADRPPRIR